MRKVGIFYFRRAEFGTDGWADYNEVHDSNGVYLLGYVRVEEAKSDTPLEALREAKPRGHEDVMNTQYLD